MLTKAQDKILEEYDEIVLDIIPDDLLDVISENLPEIYAGARDRFIGGFKTYGTSSLNKTKKELIEELKEEIEDCLNYIFMIKRLKK